MQCLDRLEKDWGWQACRHFRSIDTCGKVLSFGLHNDVQACSPASHHIFFRNSLRGLTNISANCLGKLSRLVSQTKCLPNTAALVYSFFFNHVPHAFGIRSRMRSKGFIGLLLFNRFCVLISILMKRQCFEGWISTSGSSLRKIQSLLVLQ